MMAGMTPQTNVCPQIIPHAPRSSTAQRVCVFDASAGLREGNAVALDDLLESVSTDLETIAGELEGEGDQELILQGTGDDGDLVLSVYEADAHDSLRDYRAWLRTGLPAPRPRVEVRLRVILEGSEQAINAAVASMTAALSSGFLLRAVGTSWSFAGALAAPTVPNSASQRAGDRR
jgi:hypothetical protein